MADTELSFAELERRIREMPDGPAGILNTPKLFRILNLVGGIGAIVGLLPSVFIQFFEPQMWMVWMARLGLALAVAGWVPYMVRSCVMLGWLLWRWKRDQVAQLDHDLVHFRALLRWLAGFPKEELVEYRRLAQLTQGQLTTKIGLLAGGVERLGILPVVASVFLLLRNWRALLEIPFWQAGVGILLVLLYLISTTAVLMRIRLQLYDALLSDALTRKGSG